MTMYIKYKPSSLNDCIIGVEIRNRLGEMRQAGKFENMLFYGRPGAGKSLVASLLSPNTYVLRCDGTASPTETVAHAYRAASAASLFDEGQRIVVLDEIDRLHVAAQEKCRALIDDLSHVTSFIATTNHLNDVIPALRSRMTPVSFDYDPNNLTLISKWKPRLAQIYMQEHGKEPADHIVESALKHFPDGRRMITELMYCLR